MDPKRIPIVWNSDDPENQDVPMPPPPLLAKLREAQAQGLRIMLSYTPPAYHRER